MNVIFLGLTPCEENLTNDPGAVCPVPDAAGLPYGHVKGEC